MAMRLLFAVLLALSAVAQKPLAFDVASVKPAGPLDPQKIMSGQQRIGMKIDAARVDIGSMSMMDLICLAYKVKTYQVSGPTWLAQERYTIQATLPEGAKEDQVPEMVQTLLAERFGLTFHRDEKEASTYALIVGKGGVKMKDAAPDAELAARAEAAANASGPSAATSMTGPDGSKMTMSGSPEKGMVIRGGPGGSNGAMKMTMNNGSMHMEAEKMDMTGFVTMISRFVDRPVIDMTGLKGSYQIAFDMSMEDMMNAGRAAGMNGMMMRGPGGGPGGPPPGAGAPGGTDGIEGGGGGIQQSIQALGLKLDPRKSPVERIVVDKVEKAPTEN